MEASQKSIAISCGLVLLVVLVHPSVTFGQSSVVKSVLPKTVKIVGSGGLRGLEAYQSGVLITGEGHVLTAWSYVLDGETSTVTTNDGERFKGRLVGYDARLEIAILKIEAEGYPFFDLANAVEASVGSRILAFCNCYGVATGNEPVSVQRGVISAKTKLAARRGAWQIPYNDEAYIIDAVTSNPGAAGGVVTDRKGRLVAFIGKESRDVRSGLWLNYAIPVAKLTASIEKILDGKQLNDPNTTSRRTAEPLDPKLLGFALVPDVLNRTPPYVETVTPTSAAFESGLQPDDLIVEINSMPITSCRDVAKRLGQVDRDGTVVLVVQRGSKFVTLKISLVQP
jgi:serine protease Do